MRSHFFPIDNTNDYSLRKGFWGCYLQTGRLERGNMWQRHRHHNTKVMPFTKRVQLPQNPTGPPRVGVP
jgi:hypothetical protein